MLFRSGDGCSSGGSAELWTVNGGPHVISPTPEFGASVVAFMLTHPRPAETVIPAASDWGVLAMMILLLTAGTLTLRRQVIVERR